ncbi:hypothetical protein FOMPIDRAFT_1032406 [Fomitopsis schrenkii]|uniref:Endonuclease/exonuclease/phosphatase domain-containing protein n=1 Tax=Fomitopsis schrenkii TaxID=2126942 RepID=S8DYX8_FOMSC|nr:hypothetical protein FOMPIDRAFT_1032406 [Fomitopsis schrenkii]
MRDKKIGVLVVQEAHMNEERRCKVENLFAQRLRIIATGDPENPTGKSGVAIVLNKEIVNMQNVVATTVYEGRALQVQLRLKHETTLTILGVYAPNDPDLNEFLWEDIRDFYQKPENRDIPKPDIMLGDFNLVEEPLDRMPPHKDHQGAVNTLGDLKTLLHLQDGWRQLNPTDKSFTFYQKATGSQSRIDRVYMTENMCLRSREWEIRPSGIPNTDHMMVSVSVTSEDAPWVGAGRRTVPVYVLKDKRMKEYIRTRIDKAIDHLTDLGGWRSNDENPQRILHDLKMDIRKEAIKRQKKMSSKQKQRD